MLVCIAGKNEVAVEGLAYLRSILPDDYKIVGIPNESDNGENSWQPSFKRACKESGIQLIRITDCYEIEDLIFLSLEFDKIISPKKFKSKRLYNIHFSLLPSYKGMYTSVWPLLNGEKKSGVTLHEIDSGIDTGNIIDQLELSLGTEINSRELYSLYNKKALELLKNNFPNLINAKLASTPQKEILSSYYSKSSIDFENIKIDLNKTSWEIHNQIRAFCFRDYQLPCVRGKQVYKSKIILEKPVGRVAQLIKENEVFGDFNTIDYRIRLFWDRQKELFEAAKSDNLSLIKRIKESGYDISIKNEKGWNLLMVACYNCHLELVKYLLDVGFSVNETNYKGTTVLMYAKSGAEISGDVSILQLLIGKGADISLKDDNGKSVIDYVNHSGSPLRNFFKI